MEKENHKRRPGITADTSDSGAGGKLGERKAFQMDRGSVEDPGMRDIKDAIRGMPTLDPPDALLRSVMGSIRAKRLSPWVRLLRWFQSPRSITFTPLQLAPAAAVLMVVCLSFAYYALRTEKGDFTLQGNRVPVALALRFPEARTVAVIGSFNGWQPETCTLKSVDGEPHWTITLMLRTGRYEYAFVVDGEKIIPDPGAGLREDDGFGNQNAILFVGNGNGNSA